MARGKSKAKTSTKTTLETTSTPKETVVHTKVTTQDRRVIKVFTYFVPIKDGKLVASIRPLIKKYGRAGYVCHNSGQEVTFRGRCKELETEESKKLGIQFRKESEKEVRV